MDLRDESGATFDAIILAGTGIDSLSVEITDDGTNTVVQYGSGDTITVLNALDYEVESAIYFNPSLDFS